MTPVLLRGHFACAASVHYLNIFQMGKYCIQSEAAEERRRGAKLASAEERLKIGTRRPSGAIHTHDSGSGTKESAARVFFFIGGCSRRVFCFVCFFFPPTKTIHSIHALFNERVFSGKDICSVAGTFALPPAGVLPSWLPLGRTQACRHRGASLRTHEHMRNMCPLFSLQAQSPCPCPLRSVAVPI